MLKMNLFVWLGPLLTKHIEFITKTNVCLKRSDLNNKHILICFVDPSKRGTVC